MMVKLDQLRFGAADGSDSDDDDFGGTNSDGDSGKGHNDDDNVIPLLTAK